MKRLDQALTRLGLVSTRSQAESYIKLGQVTVAGQTITKPGYLVSGAENIRLVATELYVSRAALKLASVATTLKLDFQAKTVLDIGSSTGGFSDFALRQGAKKVIAVEVGTDQLHPSLRNDPRIELYEKTDIRDVRLWSMGSGSIPIKNHSPALKPTTSEGSIPFKNYFPALRPAFSNQKLPEIIDSKNRKVISEEYRSATAESKIRFLESPPDIILADVSFISLREILPHVAEQLATVNSQIVAMVKPQFEAGQSNLKHKGVIKNDRLRRDILRDFENWSRSLFAIINKADSAVSGSKGNTERFYLLRKIR